jgi:putative hydrolases of HD superfamily
MTSTLSAETSWDPESNIPQDVMDYIESKPFNKYTQINFFFQLVALLKTQKRTGWLNMGIENPESISDHMYRMSIMTLALDPKAWASSERVPDFGKCSKIALVHDIAEALVGDIVPHDAEIDKVEKSKREYKAILYLCQIIGSYSAESAHEIKECWIDYECQRTLESTVVKDIDKFELLVQTFEYERMHNRRMDEFYGCRKVIKNEEIKKIADELISQRDEFIKANKL